MYRFFTIFVLSISLLLTSCSTTSQGQFGNNVLPNKEVSFNKWDSSLEKRNFPTDEDIGGIAGMIAVMAILGFGAL